MVSRARAWPHQRLPRFSVESELRCNIFSCLRKAPLDRLGPAALWSSWNDVVVWVRLNWHVSELALVAMLFEPGFVPFLLLYIAEKGRLLPWKRVWDSGDPLRLCCVLWSRARQLDMSRRRRVREKVERFLRGSGLVCTHLCFVRVPSRGMLALNKIRAVLRDLKSALLRDTAPEVVAFLLSRIRVCQVKPPDLLSSVSSHVSAASNARLASVAEHDDETVAFYRAFRDVAWLPFHMGVQGSACAEDASKVVSLSRTSWCFFLRDGVEACPYQGSFTQQEARSALGVPAPTSPQGMPIGVSIRGNSSGQRSLQPDTRQSSKAPGSPSSPECPHLLRSTRLHLSKLLLTQTRVTEDKIEVANGALIEVRNHPITCVKLQQAHRTMRGADVPPGGSVAPVHIKPMYGQRLLSGKRLLALITSITFDELALGSSSGP